MQELEEVEEEEEEEEWISQMLQYKTFVCKELTLSRRSNQWLKGMYVCVCGDCRETARTLLTTGCAYTGDQDRGTARIFQCYGKLNLSSV
jgi:hypothetical protein